MPRLGDTLQGEASASASVVHESVRLQRLGVPIHNTWLEKVYYAPLTTGPPSSAPATTAAAMSLFRMGVLVAASPFAVDMAIGWDGALWQSSVYTYGRPVVS